ncbi:MAG: DUF3793 family protein [Lachnospiraceae bacterium]|nr:DUF3793 family protein [Lachnospiraceae bacterium]
MLDSFLVEHCSPTLASIKMGNIFTYFYKNTKELYDYVSDIKNRLQSKGICIEILSIRDNSAIIYVYRKSALLSRLNEKEVQTFLAGYGYNSFNPDECLAVLKSRLCAENGFPHEIGIFIGYPLGDVIGFIEHNGRGSKYSGYWKVYCNEAETIRLFERFKKCKRIYSRLFAEGRSILQLTVTA